ncbi:MAG: thioredoxin-disulfide reductase [Candidatus Omnitrophota bacterium]|nr:thioredoxin-disulfide reductase [Candidatus Omnitrophota bacterium]MBU1894682.1 thioredoxin-disulfide reductase [Candidatus Omnitrophota bacterium]
MKQETYDSVIIGAGPAGLTAGIYASRARMKVLLLESYIVMGQATMTDMIENYPGVIKSSGFDLIDILKKQAETFGLECRPGTVKNVLLQDGSWNVEDESGVYQTHSVIVATGACSKKLNIPGETEFLGKGVSYCATCDGAFFRDKDIIVVGGGDTAVEEALFLTRFGKKVTVVHRRNSLRAAKILQERAFANKKIEFIWQSKIKTINGSQKVESVSVENIETGKIQDVACEGVFIFVGWQPNTGFLKGTVNLDEKGGILTDSAMNTSGKGMFAAGDCRKKLLHQVVTACGDGAVAAYSAGQYVDELKGIVYK